MLKLYEHMSASNVFSAHREAHQQRRWGEFAVQRGNGRGVAIAGTLSKEVGDSLDPREAVRRGEWVARAGAVVVVEIVRVLVVEPLALFKHVAEPRVSGDLSLEAAQVLHHADVVRVEGQTV